MSILRNCVTVSGSQNAPSIFLRPEDEGICFDPKSEEPDEPKLIPWESFPSLEVLH